jgi:hypothetical protein
MPPTVSTYALVSINGVNLPTLDPAQPQDSTVAGSIELVGNDTAEVRQTLFTPPANGNPPTVAIQLGYYSVSRSGSTLVLHPFQLDIGVDTAALSSSQLIVHHHLRPGSVAEQFLYVAQ